ncbi:hypothetical protein LINPERPRIM_LOCUS32899 [Linum perenne]
MKAHPRHVLKRPSSVSADYDDDVVPKIVIVPPDAQLQRGKIYFLMPLPPSSSTSAPAKSKRRVKEKAVDRRSSARERRELSILETEFFFLINSDRPKPVNPGRPGFSAQLSRCTIKGRPDWICARFPVLPVGPAGPVRFR